MNNCSYKNRWMAGTAFFCVLYGAVQFLSCAHYFSLKDRWEGIRDNKIRVCVQIFIPENAVDMMNDTQAKNEFLMAGKKRAWQLISGYVQNKAGSIEPLYVLKDKLDALLTDGKILYSYCGEENCLSFVDFTLDKSILDAIGR